MSTQTPQNTQLSPPSQEAAPVTGEAELERYERVMSEHKVEITVLQEIIEQYRARRQSGWGHDNMPTP
jgi:hypothetical protein